MIVKVKLIAIIPNIGKKFSELINDPPVFHFINNEFKMSSISIFLYYFFLLIYLMTKNYCK